MQVPDLLNDVIKQNAIVFFIKSTVVPTPNAAVIIVNMSGDKSQLNSNGKFNLLFDLAKVLDFSSQSTKN